MLHSFSWKETFFFGIFVCTEVEPNVVSGTCRSEESDDKSLDPIEYLLCAGQVFLLEAGLDDGGGEDDGDGIVEDGLAKDEHVEDGVDVESLEDGQRGHGVHGRDEGPEGEALLKVQGVYQAGLAHQVDAATNHQGRDGRAHDGKQQDAPQVGEKVT